MPTFHYRVNGGPELTIRTKSGQYVRAVLAIAARHEEDINVEIWFPPAMPQYGPYLYAACNNRFGNIEVGIADTRAKA
jgi:hypothetical protein